MCAILWGIPTVRQPARQLRSPKKLDSRLKFSSSCHLLFLRPVCFCKCNQFFDEVYADKYCSSQTTVNGKQISFFAVGSHSFLFWKVSFFAAECVAKSCFVEWLNDTCISIRTTVCSLIKSICGCSGKTASCFGVWQNRDAQRQSAVPRLAVVQTSIWTISLTKFSARTTV